MSSLRINGPNRLRGEVQVGGSKNAVLPILAASLLADGEIKLTNVPAISDVAVMLDVLRCFNVKVTGNHGEVVLDPRPAGPGKVPDELARSLRASILILGPALSRFGSVTMVHPGGDLIGRRPLDTHFFALETLGATIKRDHLRYAASAKQLRGQEIFLPEASVTATENAIMAAVRADGQTIIRNAASELHVADLAKFLNGLGAKIRGAGTNEIHISGVSRLGGGEHRVRADEIEAGTFVIAAALTGGDVVIRGVDPNDLQMILIKLRETGMAFTVGRDTITVKGKQQLRGTNLKTNLWPGFPTDLQPPFTVLMTQAKGTSLIHDWMYEGRFFYIDKLVVMGANIVLADPHRIIVGGPTKLTGHQLASPDVRAGITMLVAALVAEGETIIDHIEWVDRGYQRIEERLRSLGADVARVAPA